MRLITMLSVIAGSLLVMTACAGAPRAEPTSAAMEGGDFEMLWQAALDAVTLRFTVESAERDLGAIQTDHLVGGLSMSGFKSNAIGAEARMEDMLHTIRRRAFVEVAGDGTGVVVRVEKERLIRDHPDILRRGIFSVGRDIERRDDPRFGRRWICIGTDRALEARLTAEILQRYYASVERH